MNNRCRLGGFSLIELLTVIAVVAVLAGILIPTVGSARVSAKKAKTRVLFNQWAVAIEAFRQEYGYYPAFDRNLVNPSGQSTDPAGLHVFHDVLAGRRRNGDALPTYSSGTSPQAPEAQNRKLISFYTFGEVDFGETGSAAANLLRDAFDNTEIAVLVDRNLDGRITVGGSGDYTSLPAVNGITPTSGTTTADIPTAGVRAGVVFYGPAPNATAADPQFIFSWK